MTPERARDTVWYCRQCNLLLDVASASKHQDTLADHGVLRLR